ncbi:MAG: FAD-dependent oxidoreductase [Alphaproteobacteria bacterium]|nr:FAD-dependent oxidoreductase [Alphaproteobacteria bacterium]
MTSQQFDEETDVIVVGSGSAALSAALAASAGGARVLILEKSKLIGGTSAMSGAGTWIPANHHMLAAGMQDSPEEALTYIRAVSPPGWQEKEDALWRALVETAPRMLRFVEERSPLRFELVHQPDLYCEAPGSRFNGRMLSTKMLSKWLVGRWAGRIRSSTIPQFLTYREGYLGALMTKPMRTLARLGPAIVWRLVTRQVGMGAALIVGLLKGCLDQGCALRTGAPVRRLLTDGDRPGEGRVIGVEAEIDGAPRRIGARKGVVLATGGFEWDQAMLDRHFPGPVESLATPRTNAGDGQRMAEEVGAALERMDQANVYPVTATVYEGQPHARPMSDVHPPHCILVNRHAKRFVSEGDPNLGIAVDARDPATGAPLNPPCWKIFDSRYASSRPVAMLFARRAPDWLHRADSIEALAASIGLDAAALRATVDRFNGFVRQGRDEDFRRGESVWERFYSSDPARPEVNGALGTIEMPPYYATPFHRAILGTKGGPRTNARMQVLRADGSIVAGLWCAGVAMANPIGTKAVGPGTTIGPTLTYGFIAGEAILRGNA